MYVLGHITLEHVRCLYLHLYVFTFLSSELGHASPESISNTLAQQATRSSQWHRTVVLL